MTKLRKYALAAALVLPTVFAFSSKSEASSATLNTSKASSVNVRSQANTGNNVIGSINDTKSYQIKEVVNNSNGQWLKISFDGQDAYVGSPWFNISNDTKVTSAVNFRKGDSINTDIISVIKAGESVEVLSAANNGYYKVKYNGTVGYAYGVNLALPKSTNTQKTKTVASNNYSSSQTRTYSSNNTRSYSNNTRSYSNNTRSYSSNSSYSNNNSTSSSTYTGTSSSAKEIIAQRESGGSYTARNGQYIGRYQLSASYLNGDYSAANQERVADQYVAQRYGSWENALVFWNNNGWY